MKTFWIDLETTGLDSCSHKIIEFAGIYYNNEIKEDEVHYFVKPDQYPDDYERISSINGLSKEFLDQNGICEKDCYQNLLNFLNNKVDKFNKADKMIIGGYNVKFDIDFLRELFERNNNNFFNSYFYSPSIDVVSCLAEAMVENNFLGLQSYSLESIANHLGIIFKAHSALEDIKTTIMVYERIKKQLVGGFNG